MVAIRSSLSQKTGAARPFLQTVKCGGSHDSNGARASRLRREEEAPVRDSRSGKDPLAMYYGEDLFEDEGVDQGADRIESAVTHFFVGALETAAWLIGVAFVGALVGTDVESSPWFWVVLLALPPIVAAALWLRRTRKQERITFDATERT
jgi:F0F1-type ATP synthase assembly protein I